MKESKKMSNAYEEFIRSKRATAPTCGIPDCGDLHDGLFPFQRDIVMWALRRGRAAIWADCGLGKTWMALEWAAKIHEHTGDRVLILTPLAVAAQFVDEGEKMGVAVTLCRDVSDLTDAINVTNYDRLDRFPADMFGAVILDESSILKDFTSKTRNAIISAFEATPYKLACTATPSPNDFTELGNHAEFLGVMSRVEMLSMFFVHDGGSTQDWRLKGHARDDFWEWLCSWAVAVRMPSDLGYDDDGFTLPPMSITHHVVDTNMDTLAKERGRLFVDTRMGLSDQRTARRISTVDRVAVAAAMVNESDDPWIVWCDMNDESSALTAAIDDAIEVRGSDTPESKEAAIRSFSRGNERVIVTKPSICGWGVNWQHCAHVAFVGVSHSFEAWYQAIRRTYRFGQSRKVECHVITSSAEQGVIDNLKRKQRDAEEMVSQMTAIIGDGWKQAMAASRTQINYNPQHEMTIPAWVGEDDER